MVFITQRAITEEINRQHRLSQEIAGYQGQISSGVRISNSSQNPQDWVEISDIARQQATNTAWRDNLTYGQARAAQASDNLEEINNLMTRVSELIIQATSNGPGTPGRAAIAADLQGIRSAISELVNQKDYQGTPVFDDTTTVAIPVGRAVTLEAVGTRQSVSEGIDVNGTPMTIDQILADTIAAVSTGTDADRQAALVASKKALDHVIVAQSVQGVRSQRLDDNNSRLVSTSLLLTERRSSLEDTDLTETIGKLQTKLTTLEAAQAAFARINRQTLFDLLR